MLIDLYKVQHVLPVSLIQIHIVDSCIHLPERTLCAEEIYFFNLKSAMIENLLPKTIQNLPLFSTLFSSQDSHFTLEFLRISTRITKRHIITLLSATLLYNTFRCCALSILYISIWLMINILNLKCLIY